ncbi:hypothetical protein AB0I60_03490 [Actinosynnema sp. NPDC050436]|uniref:hypothetical protein n=1 Tax=Actinosynnema sp. NPDC050436 TaxID=3155659 RepID=UPI0033E7521E
MIRARNWLPLVVGLAVVSSGCSVQLVGTPVAAPVTVTTTKDKKAEATAVGLLGDLPTLDPCSLLGVADLKNFGKVEPGTVESLDYCLYHVTTPAGAKLDVMVGSLDQLASEGEARGDVRNHKGGLRIAYEDGDATQCGRRLVFSDLVTLSITVGNYGEAKTTTSELCNPADAAATATADRVLDKDVEHRTFRARSIGKLDPCTVVGKQVLAGVPGIGQAKVHPYPAGHQCRWSPDGTITAPRVRVAFSMGVPAKADGPLRTSEDIAGRATTISRTSATSIALCTAETTHMAVDDGLSELAYVSVSMAQGSQIDAACTSAKVIANEVWRQLPR